jgi:hypothetical protein
MELVRFYCYYSFFLFYLSYGKFVYFLHGHFISHNKIMNAEEFAQMPNCNLVEFIHNKWLQASGNKGGDLYVATVDDYIRTFLQVVAYHQFLKGGLGAMALAKKTQASMHSTSCSTY